VPRDDTRGIQVGRRNFIKATTLAGVAATLPATGMGSQDAAGASVPRARGKERKFLCLSDNPKTYEGFIGSVRSFPEARLLAASLQANYQKPETIVGTIREQNPDILLLCLPRMTFNFGSLYDAMGDLDIPVIVLTTNPDLIPIDANLVASLRANGASVTFVQSQDEALERLKLLASPGILEDRRAVLYGRPFDSTTVPAHNLTEDGIRRRTGVKVEYRPIEELAALYKEVPAAAAAGEMERWKKEAAEVIRVPDETILDASRLYVLLRSIIEKEGLAAVSIDCLGFTLSPNPVLPYPCLAFARLRDDGFTAACEADICGMLSSMFLEKISRRPSFMCNLMSADVQNSKIVVSHCVAPLNLNGSDAAAMRYRLHDYHGFGKGVVPEVEFPIGNEVITGGFTKDLKNFLLWPGRIQTQVKDTDRAPAGQGRMLNVCANTMDVKIKDAGRFLQNIPGLHQIMVLGNYTRSIADALYGMDVKLVGPADFSPPTA
jgi:L-fucose isomerase-like protein